MKFADPASQGRCPYAVPTKNATGKQPSWVLERANRLANQREAVIQEPAAETKAYDVLPGASSHAWEAGWFRHENGHSGRVPD